MAPRRDAPPTWLCANSAERERLLDMERRLKPVRSISLGLIAVALIICGPSVGWWTLIPLAVASAGFLIVDRGLHQADKPEFHVAAAWVISQVTIASSVVLTGGPDSPAVSWLVLPVVTLPARFGTRGLAAGVGLSALLILGATLGVDPAAVADRPEATVFPLALLGGVAMLSVALMRSDLHHRGEAVIDPLTGMLNRGALTARAGELAEQAKVTRQPIALIVGDLDRFKQVNDGHGHTAGDAVLKDVAYRLRKRLRAFDLAYRIGGEEFLVILPGADAEQAAGIAEDLGRSIRETPMAGLHVTMSFGVSASSPGSFDYETVFSDADMALYEAKRAGRDRVMTRLSVAPPLALAG